MNEVDRFKKQYILYAKRGSVLKLKPGRKIFKGLNSLDTNLLTESEMWEILLGLNNFDFENEYKNYATLWNLKYNDNTKKWEIDYSGGTRYGSKAGNTNNNYETATNYDEDFYNTLHDSNSFHTIANKHMINDGWYRNATLTLGANTDFDGAIGSGALSVSNGVWSLNSLYTPTNRTYLKNETDLLSENWGWEDYFGTSVTDKGTRWDSAAARDYNDTGINFLWDGEKLTPIKAEDTYKYSLIGMASEMGINNQNADISRIWRTIDDNTATSASSGDGDNQDSETPDKDELDANGGLGDVNPKPNINFTSNILRGKKWNFWPEIGWLGLTVLSNKANDDIAKILHRGVRAKLHTAPEYNKPIRDEYSLVQNAYNEGADKMYATAQNYLTSDASLQFAKLRETAKDVDADIDKKRLESDQYVEKTRLELQEARERTIKEHNDVANYNRDLLVDTRLKHALIDAQNRKDKADNWDKFLNAINTELYNNREEKWNKSVYYGNEVIEQEYANLQDQLEKWYLLEYGKKDITELSDSDLKLYYADLQMLQNFRNRDIGNFNLSGNLWSYPYMNYSVNNDGTSYSDVYSWLNARIGRTSASKKQGGKLTSKPKFKKGGKPALIFNKKKFLSGGALSNPFTQYFTTTNISIPKTSGASSSSVSTKSSKKSDDELSEKDIFKLFEKIEGLPNEMVDKVGKFKKILRYHNITGGNITSIASQYLNETVDFLILKQNKTKFDAAYKVALDNGALGEVAVTSDGRFYAYRKSSSKKNQRKRFVTITPEEYYKHRNSYSLVTNETLALFRLYEPSFTYDLSIFEVLNSSVGYQSFQDVLSKASITLGSVSRQISGNSVVEGDVDAAANGMAILRSLDANDRAVLLTSMVDSGLGNYKWTKLDKNDLLSVYAYVNYLILVLPANVKTWATTKTGLTDPDKAAAKLVTDYLMGRTLTTSNFNVTYSAFKNDDIKGKSGKSAADAMDKQKQGLMALIQLGVGGDQTVFNILKGKTLLNVNARYYGMTEGMKMGYQPLDLYLEESRLTMIKGSAKITFGDQVLSNYKDVAIIGSDGIVVATLPKNNDGTVNFQLLEEFTKITDKLTEEGLHPGDELYNQRLGEELKNNSTFANMITADGKLNSKFFGLFAMINAVASDKTRVREHGKAGSISLGDSGSEWFENNDELADDLIMALTPDKDHEYDLDKNDFLGEGLPYEMGLWHSYDRVYTGVLYIPINNNPINGNNADKNDMEASVVHQYEQDKLNWNKRLTAGSTSSEALNFNNE